METDVDNETLILHQIRMAQAAPEPGGDRVGTVVHAGDKGDDGAPPQVISSMESAGYCWIWNTRTGDRSKTNKNMLLSQLRKKFDDGSQVFAVVDPGITPKRGTHKCLLHADSPDREYYDTLGLAVCTKANLISPYEVERHMQHRHRSEWGAIQRERTEQQRTEDRDLQRQLIQAAVGTKPAAAVAEKAPMGSEGAPLYESLNAKPKVKRRRRRAA